MRSFRISAIATAALAIIMASAPLAEELALEERDAANDAVEFAPGATGFISPAIVEQLRQAKRDAEALGRRLQIQEGADLSALPLDEIEAEALANLQAREMLGLRSGPAPEARWSETRGFLFASFSMPPVMLRDLMEDAAARGIPTVFRGFKANSVFETRAALLEVFGSDENIVGFTIDPTVYARFEIQAVPTLIILAEPYRLCETETCETDPAPVHDRIAGGIRVIDALRMIASGRGDATEVARVLLQEGGE